MEEADEMFREILRIIAWIIILAGIAVHIIQALRPVIVSDQDLKNLKDKKEE